MLVNKILLALFILPSIIFSRETVLKGTLNGTVTDAETKTPLIGANIFLLNTKFGGTTDENGKFLIRDVPVGSYSIKFSYVGYETLSKTDILIRPLRITTVDAELSPTALKSDEVVVKAKYFSEPKDLPASTVNFSTEEIRRHPGTAGDISRILMSLPSVSKGNETRNNLVIRGGSPSENGFFVDNIEVPNINHYPTQGASGGALGILNVDFIRDANFSAGGFSAVYGDRLSSVMDISYREGNRSEVDLQVDMNLSGFGAQGEGPIDGGRGSWLFSARRSYIDALLRLFSREKISNIPAYGDVQGKVVYDVSDKLRISFIDILAIDVSSGPREDAIENGENMYGGMNNTQNTAGIGLLWLWGKNGYSQTSLSHSITTYDLKWYETRTQNMMLINDSYEQEWKFRSNNRMKLSENQLLGFGVEAKILLSSYDNQYGSFTDLLGNTTQPLRVNKKFNAQKVALYGSYGIKPFERLTLSTGIRAEYFSHTERIHLSPRFFISGNLSAVTSLYGAAGVYYQTLPLVLLTQKEAYKHLKDPVSYHFVLGLSHLLNDNTKVVVEIYDKEYDNFPLDSSQPVLFVLDELSYTTDFFLSHSSIVDNGKARSYGLEASIQKKLLEDIYGTVSGALFKTKYRDFNGIWRDRVYDNRYLFSVEGGYKPNKEWEFSIRWVYAGGAPYTPFDTALSRSANKGVLDKIRINEVRLPDFHSLNLRADKRFFFSGSNLTVFLSIWNVYNRINIPYYIWNEMENKQEEAKLWTNGILPVFGFEYEF